jgi:hypothetical protein
MPGGKLRLAGGSVTGYHGVFRFLPCGSEVSRDRGFVRTFDAD